MLAEVLRAVVYDGAGVSFVVPFSLEDARAFWVGNVLPGVRAGTRQVLLARCGDRIVGTVQNRSCRASQSTASRGRPEAARASGRAASGDRAAR